MLASDDDHKKTVKILVKQEGIDINAKDVFFVLFEVYFNYFIFQNNIWNFFKLFQTVLIRASKVDMSETCEKNIEIVKLLLEQKGIDVNSKDFYLFYLIFASSI